MGLRVGQTSTMSGPVDFFDALPALLELAANKLRERGKEASFLDWARGITNRRNNRPRDL